MGLGGSTFWQIYFSQYVVQSYGWYCFIALHLENILDTHYDGIRPLKNFLELPEVQKVMKNSYFCMFSEPQNPSLREYQIQKLACADVSINKNWLRHRAMTPFVSARSYDPK